MFRSEEGTGKTIEEAKLSACARMGVNADDDNVSYEVLEMPHKTGFLGLGGMTPAKVRVTVELPDEVPAAAEKKIVDNVIESRREAVSEEKLPAEKPEEAPVTKNAKESQKEENKAEASVPAIAVEEPSEVGSIPAVIPVASEEAESGEDVETEIDIEANAKVKAAVDYLKDVVSHMGIEDAAFSAVRKGEATIIRIEGEKLGALIGRRGETMESLSYLASLVANRLDGDYIKLGLDVSGYRGKREQDLAALAQRIGNKVRKTGRSFAMEPMNPYERRLIHSAIGKMEGVRSESKGEGKDRRVVIYSTAPGAQIENNYSERRGKNAGRGGNRGAGRAGGSGKGERSARTGGRSSGNRGRGPRGGSRPSSVPDREYVQRNVENAAPVAPKRTEKVDDLAGFNFGKIEL